MNEEERKKATWGDAEYIPITAKNDILGFGEARRGLIYVFEYSFSKVEVSVVNKKTGEIIENNETSIGWDAVGSDNREKARETALEALAFVNVLQDDW